MNGVEMDNRTPADLIQSKEWQDLKAQEYNKYTKINAQQLAKNPIYMDCIRAPKGQKFVQWDAHALEPVIIAEFSGDPVYKDLYASGKPHDIYLYVTCRLLDKTGEISKLYLPDNPTKESVAATKKKFKRERSISKVFHLMSGYKAGANSIYRKLLLENVDITLDEVKENHKIYWGPDLFGGILDFEAHLLAERTQRDGYIENGLGRPLVVTDRKEKDILNIFAQSTGHDVLDIMVSNLDELVKGSGIQARPSIYDFHDETIWLCPEEQADDMAALVVRSLEKTNKELGFGIPITGGPEITDTFTQFKQPDPVDWYSNHE